MDTTVRRLTRALMRPGGVNPFDLIYFRPYLESLLDSDWLQRESDAFDTWVGRESSRPLVMQLLDRPLGSNVLVAALAAARYWEEEWRIDPDFYPRAGALRLLYFALALAVTEVHAGPLFDADAREHIRQRLQSTDQVWGILHECEALGAFIRKRLRPEPLFLRKASEAEIVLRWRRRCIPVQCKGIRPGTGRFVGRELFTRLACGIARDATLNRRRIRVTVKSRQKLEPDDLDAIRRFVRSLPDRSGGWLSLMLGQRLFMIRTDRLTGTITPAQANAYAEQFGLYAVFLLGNPGPSDDKENQNLHTIVGLDMQPPDEHLDRAVRDALKQAAKQLQRDGPGIAAIHFFDPQPAFDNDEELPAWMQRVIWPRLRSYSQMMAVIVSAEPDLSSPSSTGRTYSRILTAPDRFPSGLPLGTD